MFIEKPFVAQTDGGTFG